MKKVILSISILTTMALALPSQATNSLNSEVELNYTGEKITIINDTSDKLKIHTGYGEVSLNPRGGKTSFTCNTSKSVKLDGKVLFKITNDMCGETIKLSEYL